MSDPILNIVQGETVYFSSFSQGSILNYDWEFPGASPTGATGENPDVRYNNIGEYSVKLTTTDSFGVVRSELKENVIKVSQSPWGVEFSADPPVKNSGFLLFGEPLTFLDVSLGFPDYTEWTFPNGGGLTSGVTFSNKTDVGPIYYRDWKKMTGSHQGNVNSNFVGEVTLYSESPFALGSDSGLINFRKMGPNEFYEESYDYDLDQGLTAGHINSNVYGQKSRFWDGFEATGPTSCGISYYPAIFTYSFPGIPDWGSVASLFNNVGSLKLRFSDQMGSIWSYGLTGFTGPFYPHAHTEYLSIYGRAFSPFNIVSSGIYNASSSSLTESISQEYISPYTVSDCILEGNYTSPGDIGGISNPNFVLGYNNFNDSEISPLQKSVYWLYMSPLSQSSGINCLIAKQTIGKLLEHPSGLPDPNGNSMENVPTVGMVTSADLHIKSWSYYGGSTFKSYFDTGSFSDSWNALNPNLKISSTGKFPCIPSQYALNPSNYLNQYPLSIRIRVEYENSQVYNTYVYFGKSSNSWPSEFRFNTPASITGSGGAKNIGNDLVQSANNPKASWILVQDNTYGIGVASYINAYLDDPSLGIPGGTGDLIAVAEPLYVLPDPYSDIANGYSPTNPSYYPNGPDSYGLSMEVKNPKISSVRITEMYGRQPLIGFSGPFDAFGSVDDVLMKCPMTWDYGTFTGHVLPNSSVADFNSSPYSYLGLSSYMKPFGSGVLSQGPTSNKKSGISFGGSVG